MSLYVYGVVHADAEPLVRGTVGIDEQALSVVAFEGVAAVVSRLPTEAQSRSREFVTSHAQVLDKLNTLGTVIPVRVGQVMRSDEAVVADVLQPGLGHLHGLLDALAGRDQFVVRAMYNEPAILAEIVQDSPEVARLRERTRALPDDVGQSERFRLGELVAHELDARRQHDGAIVMEAVEPFIASRVLRESSDMHRMFEAAYLVDEDCRAGFEEALESVAEAMVERARLQLLGPMPPYDFVGD